MEDYIDFGVVFRIDDLDSGVFYIGETTNKESWDSGYMGTGSDKWQKDIRLKPNDINAHRYKRSILREGFNSKMALYKTELEEILVYAEYVGGLLRITNPSCKKCEDSYKSYEYIRQFSRIDIKGLRLGLNMEWEKISSIERAYESLGKNLFSYDEYIEDYELNIDLKNNFKSAKNNFISAVKENAIDEELIKIDNWSEYISKFMKNLASFTEGELASYETRKITKNELEEKLNNINSHLNNVSDIKAIRKTLDSENKIRFILLFKNEEYTQKFYEAQRLLKAKRILETVKIRNTWKTNNSNKGISTIVKCIKDNKEYFFELKFHTSDSFNNEKAIKECYDIIRDRENYSDEEREKADDKQYELANSLNVPPGVFEIQSF